jgi:assimilatory nitrate reductase catalytic subunit
MTVSGRPGAVEIAGDPAFPVNRGELCVKGWTAGEALAHPERLTSPLVRDARGVLAPSSWESALDRIEHGLREVQTRHGRDAAGVFGSGSLTNEKAYLLGKLARVALRTRHVDYNGRWCMSSAAAAARASLGIDRGLPFPVEDIALADVIVLVGANVAETMPPLMQHLRAQRERGGTLIVVDARTTATARAATVHLRLAPGTDTALANGLLHVLVRDGRLDEAFIRDRTEGFERVRAVVASYWPERVERVTGVPEGLVEEAARLLGQARTAIILTGRGAEQQSHGTENVHAFINLALALGMVGKRHAGWGCITGQGNGQGGREHGQKADQLPGYRSIEDPAARAHVAAVWGVREEDLPRSGPSAFELLDGMGRDGGVRALLVMGSNIVVSSPDASRIERRLRALDLLVVCDFFLSETAALAHVVLPTAQWAEEDGTTTSLEGRLLLRHRVFAPPPGVRTDLEILRELGARLAGSRLFPTSDAREIFDELRRASAGGPADYSGITYERIAREGGVFWPCPREDHPGTPRPLESGFPTPGGRARFHPVLHHGPAEPTDDAWPLWLTTGRLLAHYQSGTQTRRIAALSTLAPEPFVEMAFSTAERFGVAPGDRVVVATRRGQATFAARLTDDARDDTLFVPFHWSGDRRANTLTIAALDPTSRMPELKVCAARIARVVKPGEVA